MASWNEALHPRGAHGRFGHGSGSKKLTHAERATGNATLDSFKPRKFANNTEATRYLNANKPKLHASQRDAVNRYSGDTFFDLNKQLRAGDTSHPDIARIDKAMQPLHEDLMVNRHVGLEAFGLNTGNADHLENLVGRKLVDRAYASTSIGTPYGGGLGGVTMHIVTPKGTPAVLAGSISNNPAEREVLLSRNQPLAIAKVTKNQRGGYDMYLIALPKEHK